MHILVTGGAGYIGSHTCKALAAKGITPVVYDDLSTGHKQAVQFGPFVEGDILDTDLLEATLRRFNIAAVMHFAASANVGVSCARPADYYRNNVIGTLSLLDAMRRCDVDKLIFSSTCATYGVPVHMPISEMHPQQPINPYGATKHMVERILHDYAEAYGLQSIALRYFNAAGADAQAQLGECHDPETHLIPLALQAAEDDTTLTIFGDDYPTADGTCVRDYVHVDDLAQAHVLALGRLANRHVHGFEGYNLGNGQGFSVRQIITCVEAVTRKRLRVQIGPRRAGDPPRLVADAQKAAQTLRWVPKHTALEDLVASAWNWHTAVQQRNRGHARRPTRQDSVEAAL